MSKTHFKQPLANFLLPFPPGDLEWRAGSVSKKGDKVQLLPYITARAVMDRLDNVVGPENWRAEYHKTPIGEGLECRLSIQMKDGSWVTKTDAAEPSNIEPIKGAYSDALKRAAVHWGIGRYLYTLDVRWHQIKDKGDIYISSKGRFIGYADIPALPLQALPPSTPSPEPPRVSAPVQKTEPVQETEEEERDPGWKNDQKWFCAKCDQYGGYANIKAWTLENNWGKPSAWTTERRRNFVMKLGKSPDMIPPAWR